MRSAIIPIEYVTNSSNNCGSLMWVHRGTSNLDYTFPKYASSIRVSYMNMERECVQAIAVATGRPRLPQTMLSEIWHLTLAPSVTKLLCLSKMLTPLMPKI